MPSISTQPNRAYPNVPEVTEDSVSHTLALQSIKDALLTHERRDNNYLKSFIRFEELVELGIIDESGEFVLNLTTGGSAVALDDLSDVTIASLVDNNILGYDFASGQWTSQNAGDLGLSVVGHTHPGSSVVEFDDLSDVDLTGASDFDMLFRTGGDWVPTAGDLQWDGGNLYIDTGDINFYGVGGQVTQAIRQDFPTVSDLQIEVNFGDLVLAVQGDVFLANNADFILENRSWIKWDDEGGTPVELITLLVAGDSEFTSVVLLLPFEGADASTTTTDLSASNHSPITFISDTEIDTAQQNSGTSSLKIGGTALDVLSIPDSADWDFLGGDFTIDIAFRFNTVATTQLVSYYDAGLASRSWSFGYDSSAGLRFLFSDDGGSATLIDRPWTASPNVWYQIRASRIGTNIYFFIDGVLQGAAHNIGTESLFNADADLCIGGLGPPSNPSLILDGWIDDIRLTKGVGRSSATFTLPTGAWPTGLGGFRIGNTAQPITVVGTSLLVSPTATFLLAVDMLSTLNVDGDATFGSDVLIQGPDNIGSVLYTHDDTDFFTTYLNTTLHNIAGATLNIVEQPSGTKTITIDGLLGNTDPLIPLIHWYDTGTNVDRRMLLLTEDNGESATGGFFVDLNFAPSTTENRLTIGNSGHLGDIIAIRAGGTLQLVNATELQVFNSDNTAWAISGHDDTDFNTDFINTTDWNITGIAALNVVNYTFDVDQTVGAGQDNYVLTYDDGDGEISLEAIPPPPTHTGEVTGDVVLTVDVTSITNRSDVVADADDDVAIHDDSDGTFKKVNLSSITDAGFF